MKTRRYEVHILIVLSLQRLYKKIKRFQIKLLQFKLNQINIKSNRTKQNNVLN